MSSSPSTPCPPPSRASSPSPTLSSSSPPPTPPSPPTIPQTPPSTVSTEANLAPSPLFPSLHRVVFAIGLTLLVTNILSLVLLLKSANGDRVRTSATEQPQTYCLDQAQVEELISTQRAKLTAYFIQQLQYIAVQDMECYFIRNVIRFFWGIFAVVCALILLNSDEWVTRRNRRWKLRDLAQSKVDAGKEERWKVNFGDVDGSFD
ncbi:hypothetical protein BDZ91DRAFT_851142 [Kalaharituber pfeilii]|nr:hypothetical protein BDZ91DRAFT_851142 [Kalaharituber pfeilii]